MQEMDRIEGRRVHTLSVDTTYLEQGSRCMQRRICWREVRSDRMKSDVRAEGIVLIVMSWRCIFGEDGGISGGRTCRIIW